MATALICDMCDTEQADMIVTNLGNGDTLAIGQNCLPDFGRTLIGEVAETEDLPPIGADGSGWPGDVNLDGLPPGMNATMAKAWKEAEEEARAELEAEAAAGNAGESVETVQEHGLRVDPAIGSEAASEAPGGAETPV